VCAEGHAEADGEVERIEAPDVEAQGGGDRDAPTRQHGDARLAERGRRVELTVPEKLDDADDGHGLAEEYAAGAAAVQDPGLRRVADVETRRRGRRELAGMPAHRPGEAGRSAEVHEVRVAAEGLVGVAGWKHAAGLECVRVAEGAADREAVLEAGR
jgi:hypothetical protein